MEKNFKRLSLALLALGLSAPAFADNCVMVPSQQGGFKVGIDALYLRPTNSDLNYATVITFPSNFTAGYERNAEIDPSFEWGFYAQVGYLVPCTGNDITLGYTYLRSEERDAVEVGTTFDGTRAVGVVPVGSGSLFAAGAINFSDAIGKSEIDLNVVDLEGGQRFTTGCYDMRMFAGVRYANLDHQLKTVARRFLTGGNATADGFQEFKSDYRGIGPRLGVDARYCLNSGFGVDANLSTALLVGTVDSSYFARRVTTTPTTTDFAVKNGSRERIVPVLEAKLGVDYTHIIDCRCKSSIVFEAGYQVTNYFNAVDRPRVLNSQGTAGTSIIYQNNTSDVAFDGPYLGVKYYA